MLRRFFDSVSGGRSPFVSVVKLNGIIAASTSGVPVAGRISADRVQPWLEAAFGLNLPPNPARKAVALLINSPGGSPGQSEEIYNSIRHLRQRCNVPVYAFAGDVAASGGYMLMCAGDKLFARETSLVGSIGVIAPQFGFTQAIERLGIERRVYTAGSAKAQIDPFTEPTPAQESALQGILDEMHDVFKRLVVRARGDALQSSSDTGTDVFSGAAWVGPTAVKLGLVDGISDYRATMQQEFGPDVKFRVYSRTKPSLRDFMNGGRPSILTLLSGSGAVHPSELMLALSAELQDRMLWQRYGL